MPVPAEIQAVFGRFQNLNLLVLLDGLREGRIALQAWLSGSRLCPIAHGLPTGSRVCELRALGQAAEPDTGCHFAARLLGAEPDVVTRFVQFWDDGVFTDDQLLRQLKEVWTERSADAEAVQALLQNEPTTQGVQSTPRDLPVVFGRAGRERAGELQANKPLPQRRGPRHHQNRTVRHIHATGQEAADTNGDIHAGERSQKQACREQ